MRRYLRHPIGLFGRRQPVAFRTVVEIWFLAFDWIDDTPHSMRASSMDLILYPDVVIRIVGIAQWQDKYWCGAFGPTPIFIPKLGNTEFFIGHDVCT